MSLQRGGKQKGVSCWCRTHPVLGARQYKSQSIQTLFLKKEEEAKWYITVVCYTKIIKNQKNYKVRSRGASRQTLRKRVKRGSQFRGQPGRRDSWPAMAESSNGGSASVGRWLRSKEPARLLELLEEGHTGLCALQGELGERKTKHTGM